MNCLKYLTIEIKRANHHVKKVVLVSLCFCIFILISLFAITKKSNLSANKSKYCIGLVGAQDNELLQLGLFVLKNLDSTKYVLDLQSYTSETEAKKALNEKEIIAYAVIPQDFVSSIYYLQNGSTITYYTDSGLKGITNIVMDEVINLASNLILYTESGLFTLIDFMSQKGLSFKTQDEHIEKIFTQYMKIILNRQKITSVKELGISNGVSLICYYFCALFLLYILLIPFSGISFFSDQNQAFKIIVKANGINSFKQIFSELAAFFYMNFISFLIIVILCTILFAFGSINFPEFAESKAFTFFTKCFAFLPAALCLWTFEFFVLEIAPGLISKVICLFTIIFSFSFCSGFFYPKNFLPLWVRNFGEIIPTGISFTYTTKLFLPDKQILSFILIILYALVFFASTVITRNIKLKNGGCK